MIGAVSVGNVMENGSENVESLALMLYNTFGIYVKLFKLYGMEIYRIHLLSIYISEEMLGNLVRRKTC